MQRNGEVGLIQMKKKIETLTEEDLITDVLNRDSNTTDLKMLREQKMWRKSRKQCENKINTLIKGLKKKRRGGRKKFQSWKLE